MGRGRAVQAKGTMGAKTWSGGVPRTRKTGAPVPCWGLPGLGTPGQTGLFPQRSTVCLPHPWRCGHWCPAWREPVVELGGRESRTWCGSSAHWLGDLGHTSPSLTASPSEL